MTKYDLDAIAKAAKTDVSCTIPGSILLYLANAIKEKHIQMDKLLAIGKAVDADVGHMEQALDANETVGCFLLGLIQEKFGDEFLDMFIGDGPSASAEGSETIN